MPGSPGEALESSGLLDERFFIYSEETDLCLRVKRGGWDVRHLPAMTILHHAGKAGLNAKVTAQEVFARLQFARKNFSPLHRWVYVAALWVQHLARALYPVGRERRAVSRRALRVLLGREGSPYMPPPPHGVVARGT